MSSNDVLVFRLVLQLIRSGSNGVGLAEYAAASENMTVTRPPEVSPAEAAGLPIAGLTAHQPITQCRGQARRKWPAKEHFYCCCIRGLRTDEVLDYKTPEGAALNSPSAGRSSALVTFALKKLTFSKRQLVPLLMNFKAENLEYLVSLVKEGKLKTVIDWTHPLSKAEELGLRLSIDMQLGRLLSSLK
ncbi:quinone-oxidoreductase-like protein [Pyrus ussuriensis x Pyrus communis]|uniref:Quinone-oxidoreductase-like protein n=1 Tax=Pyrus ussuriensis x Pyrus communis TaxID=2448454 RepID=A0A5N5GFJ5_9ROSA|nr:quinone-oxidoreductase-like protein [Pyrus ussuriensis x Pyrus communis]